MKKKLYNSPLTEVTNVNLESVVLAGSPTPPVPPEPVPAPGYRPSRYRYGEVAQ